MWILYHKLFKCKYLDSASKDSNIVEEALFVAIWAWEEKDTLFFRTSQAVASQGPG